MTLLEVFEAGRGQITASYPWTGPCWGPNAHFAGFSNGLATCVFDRFEGRVYALEIFSTSTSEAWRWLDPDTAAEYLTSMSNEGINTNIAFDDVVFQELVATDALLKLNEIIPENDSAR